MNIEPAILFGAISATVTALTTAIIALFRIISSYSEDLKAERDKALTLAQEQSRQITEQSEQISRLVRSLETLTYGLERWGAPPNVRSRSERSERDA
jgi:ABC-type transporter Mla subunit MlaD